jgi:hypothetical protein
MANVTISGLAAGTALVGTEPFPGVQASNTVKFTATQIATFAWTTPVLTGNVSLSTIITPATNTDLTVTPNGTGAVLLNSTTNIGLKSSITTVGLGSADATITTKGAYNLILRTNDATANQGIITINDGVNGDISISPDGTGQLLVLKNILGSTAIRSSGPTSGVGYATGAGGTVTQATSKATGVTLSKVCGQITTAADALAAATSVSFVVTNTAVAAGDVMVLNLVSGGTAGAYTLNAACTAGSATITIRNVTAASLSETLVIGFVLVKAVTA